MPYGVPDDVPRSVVPGQPASPAPAPVGDAQPAHAGRPAAWSASYAPAPPAPAPRPVQPPRPVTPPRPRTPGAGVGTVGVVVALSLLSLAVLLIAERQGDFTGPVGLTALGIGIVLCGLGIIVSGLRGRTSGGLGGLAVVGILVAVPLGAVQNASWVWSSDSQHDFSADGAIYVTDRADAANGYSIGFGDVTIDLTEVPMTSADPRGPHLARGRRPHRRRPQRRQHLRRRRRRRRHRAAGTSTARARAWTASA